jgi:CheY-like chemotaxis protein
MNNGPIHILLADDDEDDRLFFKDALEDLKINTIVKTLNDGVELMKYLSGVQNEIPHILFLDLNMPYKTGVECLTEIKSMVHLNDMAIAIYSTSASEKEIEETFVQGANIYIKKPGDFGTLKKLLGEVIAINWQYHTSGLNRDTFLLSI